MTVDAHRRRDRRRGLASLAVGLVTSLTTMAAVAAGTLGSFNATLGTRDNTATGTLYLQIVGAGGDVPCDSYLIAGSIDKNTGTCGVDLYGGITAQRAPSTAAGVLTYTFRNGGTATANGLTMTPGPCQSAANGTVNGSGNLCDWVQVTVQSGTTTLFTGTATALAAAGRIDVLTKLYPPPATPTGTATTASTTPSTTNTTSAAPTPTTSAIPGGAGIPLTFTVKINDPADGSVNNTYQGLKIAQQLTFQLTA